MDMHKFTYFIIKTSLTPRNGTINGDDNEDGNGDGHGEGILDLEIGDMSEQKFTTQTQRS